MNCSFIAYPAELEHKNVLEVFSGEPIGRKNGQETLTCGKSHKKNTKTFVEQSGDGRLFLKSFHAGNMVISSTGILLQNLFFFVVCIADNNKYKSRVHVLSQPHYLLQSSLVALTTFHYRRARRRAR